MLSHNRWKSPVATRAGISLWRDVAAALIGRTVCGLTL
jgi:hypothetical protein